MALEAASELPFAEVEIGGDLAHFGVWKEPNAVNRAKHRTVGLARRGYPRAQCLPEYGQCGFRALRSQEAFLQIAPGSVPNLFQRKRLANKRRWLLA